VLVVGVQEVRRAISPTTVTVFNGRGSPIEWMWDDGHRGPIESWMFTELGPYEETTVQVPRALVIDARVASVRLPVQPPLEER